MLKLAYTFYHACIFWLGVTADALLLISVIFSLLYAAFLLPLSLSPFRGRVRPRPWALPLALALSVALLFSPAGRILAVTLSLSLDHLLGGFNEWKQYGAAGLWLSGAGLGLFRLARRSRAAGRALNNLPEAPADAAFEEAGLRLSLAKVRLKEFEAEAVSPFSWGIVQRFIGVPRKFQACFDYEERYAIYLHELTHIKNRDSLKYLAIGAVKALFWFNPIIGLALKRYKNHLEIACDRSLIAKHGLDPLKYSRLMLRSVQGGGAAAVLAPGFSAAYGDISRRLGYIFGDGRIIPTGKDRLLTTLCLSLAALSLFGLNPELIGPPNEPIPRDEVRSMPDGSQALVRLTFHWQGALGGYAISKATPVDEDD